MDAPVPGGGVAPSIWGGASANAETEAEEDGIDIDELNEVVEDAAVKEAMNDWQVGNLEKMFFATCNVLAYHPDLLSFQSTKIDGKEYKVPCWKPGTKITRNANNTARKPRTQKVHGTLYKDQGKKTTMETTDITLQDYIACAGLRTCSAQVCEPPSILSLPLLPSLPSFSFRPFVKTYLVNT